MHKFLFYNKFIIFLYMFRALCALIIRRSNCIIQHLVSSHSVGGRQQCLKHVEEYNKLIIKQEFVH